MKRDNVLARGVRDSPENFLTLVERASIGWFDHEESIEATQALVMAMWRELGRMRYCLELLATAQLKKGEKLPED